nr:CD209 antigen isoform X1 [Taeniopygia guttata]
MGSGESRKTDEARHHLRNWKGSWGNNVGLGKATPSDDSERKAGGKALILILKESSTFPESLLHEGLPSTAKSARTLADSPTAMRLSTGCCWEQEPRVAGTHLCSSAVDLVQQQTSCTDGPWRTEESPSYGKQTLEGRCQFCPVGWLWDAGQCYYFSSAKKNWEQSREDCCSRGAQLVTIQTNTTLAFLVRTANMDAFHVGLKQDGFRSEWKWLDGTTMEGIFLIQRYTRSFQACGRVSGLGLLGGACTEALRWVCKQSAATVQWLQSSPPAFLWGNTTYSCVRP